MTPTPTVCDPATPKECATYHYTGTMYFAGTWNGTAPYVGYIFYNETTARTDFVDQPIMFTGTMAGCGTGSIHLSAIGYTDNVPTTEGFHLHGNLRDLAGTASVGMGHVVDIDFPFDAFLGASGFNFHLTGTMLCM